MAEDQNPLLGNLDTGDEPWSLEETQVRILDELKKLLSNGKVDTKTLGIISKNISVLAKDSKIVRDMDEQLKNIAGSSKKDEQHSDVLSKAFKKESIDRRKDNKALRKDITDSAAVKKLRGKGGNLDVSTGSILENIAKFGGSLKEMAALAGGGLFGSLIAILGNQIDVYQQLTGVGQTFNGSMLAMSRQAGLAGLSLSDMTQAIIKHSITAARMGVPALMAHQKEVRKSLITFGMLGFKTQELVDYSIDHLEQLRITDRFNAMTDIQRRMATVDYLKNLTALSKLTGKSREELAKSAKQEANDLTMHAVRLSLSGKALEKFQELTKPGGPFEKALQALPESMRKPFKQAFLLAATGQSVMLNEQMAKLRAMGAISDETVNQLQKVGKTFAAVDLQGAVESLMDGMTNLSPRLRKLVGEATAIPTHRLKEFALLIADAGQHVSSFGDKFPQLIKSITDAVGPDKMDPLTKALANLESVTKIAMGAFKSGIIEFFGPALESAAGWLTTAAEKLAEFVEWIGKSSIIKGLIESFRALDSQWKAFAGYLAAGIPILLSVFAAFKGLKIIKAIFKFMTGSSGAAKASDTLRKAQLKAARATDKFSRSVSKAGMSAAGGGGRGRGRKGRGARGILGKAVGAVTGGGGGIAGRVMGGAGKVLGGALRLAGKAFVPLAALMAIGDAVGGYQRAGENFELKEGQEATAGQKASSALGGVASGLTMGLLDEKTAARWFGSLFGAGKDTAKEKAKEKAESVAKVAAGVPNQTGIVTVAERAATLKALETSNDQRKTMINLLQKMQEDTQSTARSTRKAEPDPNKDMIIY